MIKLLMTMLINDYDVEDFDGGGIIMLVTVTMGITEKTYGGEYDEAEHENDNAYDGDDRDGSGGGRDSMNQDCDYSKSGDNVLEMTTIVMVVTLAMTVMKCRLNEDSIYDGVNGDNEDGEFTVMKL